ncbi:small GTP-binding protein [Histomonas meleagridis]|uniref:small GTP-binding protein n=1 Tax=Histomonas meleagridis TaxID=135588 RepID=UPI00355A62E8|nr:small GTP-binding protein [Histomonas meleagridis]KAH0804625.1 small GTP-binding protein [Histomonas meleagridis]
MRHGFKTILIGESGVGKTCILNRALKRTFDIDTSSTIGASNIDFSFENSEGNTIRFCIWDTAGQEYFRTLVPLYFKGASIAIIVFDISDELSFDKLDEWDQMLKEKAPEKVLKVLVGNKIDLGDHRKIPFQRALEYSQMIGAVTYLETSALTGEGVVELFQFIANECDLDTIRLDDNSEPEEEEEMGHMCC